MTEAREIDESPGLIRFFGVVYLLYGVGGFLVTLIQMFFASRQYPALAHWMTLLFCQKAAWMLLWGAIGIGCLRFSHWARGLVIALCLIKLPESICSSFLLILSSGQAMPGLGEHAPIIMTLISCAQMASTAVLALVVSFFLSESAHATFLNHNHRPDWSDRYQSAPFTTLIWSLGAAFGGAFGLVFVAMVLPDLRTSFGSWGIAQNITKIAVGVLGTVWLLQQRGRRAWWLFAGVAVACAAYFFIPGQAQYSGDLGDIISRFIQSSGIQGKDGAEFGQKLSGLLSAFSGWPIRLAMTVYFSFILGFLYVAKEQFQDRLGARADVGTVVSDPRTLRTLLHYIALALFVLVFAVPIGKAVVRKVSWTRLTVEFDLVRRPSGSGQAAVMDSAEKIVRKRLGQSVLAEHRVRREGPDRLRVEVRGYNDIKGLKELIRRPGVLEFCAVDDSTPAVKALAAMEERDDAEAAKLVPAGIRLLQGADQTRYLVKGKALPMAGHLQEAKVGLDEKVSYRRVHVQLDAQGSAMLEALTRPNVGGRIAIVLDGVVYTAPRIKAPIKHGSAIIEGGYSPGEAHELSVVLGAGPLPVPVKSIQDAEDAAMIKKADEKPLISR